jgi:hypothetical protein
MESLTTMRGVNMRVKTSRHQPAKSSKQGFDKVLHSAAKSTADNQAIQ